MTMTAAENLITTFFTNPVTFFTSIDGTKMVETFNTLRFKHEARPVMDLAADIMSHKRMMKRLRRAA
jgi:hypothetical protein